MEEKRFVDPAFSENANSAQQDDLNRKQIFADSTMKPSERPAVPTEFTDTAVPAFDGRVVLDKEYAARRNRSAAPQKTISVSDVRHAGLSSDYVVSRPISEKRTPHTRRRKLSVPRQLCSGETPAYAARRIVRQLAALTLFCLIIFGILQLKGFIVDQLTDNTYGSLEMSSLYSEPVRCSFTMETVSSQDDYAAARAVCAGMGAPLTDSSVFDKEEDDNTVFPDEIKGYMESVLGEDHVSLKKNVSNMDLLIQIHESLRADHPVIVLLSEKDGETFSLQYAVVTAMDVEQNTITVHRAASGAVTYTLEEFIAASRFKNYEDMPSAVRIGLLFGSWAHNTAIFVE